MISSINQVLRYEKDKVNLHSEMLTSHYMHPDLLAHVQALILIETYLLV